MKLFKIYLSIFGIVFTIIIISRFFPHTYKVERSVMINKPQTEVFNYMKNLKNWETWSLWNKTVDSTLYYFYNNKFDTLGGRQYVRGEVIGNGVFEITNFITNKQIGFTLTVNGGDRTAAGTFIFEPKNNQTNLIWVDSGDVGFNPLKRFMIPFVTKNTAVTLDAGLKNIKQQLEK